jgi:hypothetical protein
LNILTLIQPWLWVFSVNICRTKIQEARHCNAVYTESGKEYSYNMFRSLRLICQEREEHSWD